MLAGNKRSPVFPISSFPGAAAIQSREHRSSGLLARCYISLASSRKRFLSRAQNTLPPPPFHHRCASSVLGSAIRPGRRGGRLARHILTPMLVPSRCLPIRACAARPSVPVRAHPRFQIRPAEFSVHLASFIECGDAAFDVTEALENSEAA